MIFIAMLTGALIAIPSTALVVRELGDEEKQAEEDVSDDNGAEKDDEEEMDNTTNEESDENTNTEEITIDEESEKHTEYEYAIEVVENNEEQSTYNLIFNFESKAENLKVVYDQPVMLTGQLEVANSDLKIVFGLGYENRHIDLDGYAAVGQHPVLGDVYKLETEYNDSNGTHEATTYFNTEINDSDVCTGTPVAPLSPPCGFSYLDVAKYSTDPHDALNLYCIDLKANDSIDSRDTCDRVALTIEMQKESK